MKATPAERKQKKRTIELSDDWHQDEPLAYLVKCFRTTLYEHQVFADLSDARHFAECQCQDADEAGEPQDWEIYPLYAGHPEIV